LPVAKSGTEFQRLLSGGNRPRVGHLCHTAESLLAHCLGHKQKAIGTREFDL
jgi:hypothetical protein